MLIHKNYKVGELIFSLNAKENNSLWSHINQYSPFECVNISNQKQLFQLNIIDTNDVDIRERKLIGKYDNDNLTLTIYNNNDGFIVEFSSSLFNDSIFLNVLNNGIAYITLEYSNPSATLFALNNALMLLYAYFASNYDTLLMHASVVYDNNDNGVAFHAKSGTGKSTQSRLWIENIKGVALLNDDNPVIRVIDNNVFVYGSPWSGKTPCYKNIRAKLKGFVRVVQAPENRITKLSTLKSFASLLPSFSNLPWDKEHISKIHLTIEKIILSTNCYQLECLPEASAAKLAYQKILKNE